MEIENTHLRNAFIYITFLLTAFPLLTFGARSIITIVWSILGVFLYFKESKFNTTLNNDILWFLLPFIMLFISLIYSENISYGVNSLTKILSFILMPFIFFLNRGVINKKNEKIILYIFSISVVILVIYQIIMVFFNQEFLLQELTSQEIRANGYKLISQINEESIYRIKLRRFRNYIIDISNTHTTYQGLWVCFVFFFFVIELFREKRKMLKALFFIMASILLTWLYFISARMPLLALVISGLITIIFFGGFSKMELVKLGLPLIALVVITLSFKNPISIRVKESFNTGLKLLNKDTKVSEFNSTNVRYGIYYCSLKLINENFLFGVGIGDMQDKLNNCYANSIASNIYTWQDYNTHNQYFFFLVSSGVFGFITFLLFLFYSVKSSYKNKNVIHFFFICCVSLIFLTENMLERSDGVIFFSFFNSLYIFNVINKPIKK